MTKNNHRMLAVFWTVAAICWAAIGIVRYIYADSTMQIIHATALFLLAGVAAWAAVRRFRKSERADDLSRPIA